MNKVTIHDATFGFGARFRAEETEITEKTVRFGKYAGRTRRRTFHNWCVATPALFEEMLAINRLADRLEKRARIFREKLRAGEKPL